MRAVRIDASGVAGPLQTLARSKASEPVALPLAGGRTLAVWATVRGFRAALAGKSGPFRPTAAPVGAPPGRYHFNSTNRDIRTGGAWAIAGWARRGVVRLSVRRF